MHFHAFYNRLCPAPQTEKYSQTKANFLFSHSHKCHRTARFYYFQQFHFTLTLLFDLRECFATHPTSTGKVPALISFCSVIIVHVLAVTTFFASLQTKIKLLNPFPPLMSPCYVREQENEGGEAM